MLLTLLTFFNSWKLLTNFVKSSILDVWQGSEDASINPLQPDVPFLYP